ncbi:MAG: hypothetical protein CMQ38_11835 [Gammaproteobacteria bacterium]|nr:hypothetical protein [Gammaproteobacteria bacterium]|tara:strand:- start:671 stop:1225 length:555 start_codon:yes stop_codon:yes gene_type:complete
MKLPKRYLKQEEQLKTLIGEAIDLWVNIEFSIIRIFAMALHIEDEDLARIIQHVNTFRILLQMTDSAVRNRFKTPGLRKHWLSILEYVRELSGDRNYIVHAGIMMDEYKTKAGHDHIKPTIGPSNLVILGVEQNHEPIDIREIKELISDFKQANRFLLDLEVEWENVWDKSLSEGKQPSFRKNF